MVEPAQVYNGVTWEDVTTSTTNNLLRGNDNTPMIPKQPQQDNSIFINLTHLKDEERCAKTLKNIFSKAEDPTRVFVGLVEHNNDTKMKDCRDLYCIAAGAGQDRNEHAEHCPHYKQMEHLAVFAKGAKGPIVSRALGRKLLGNQEFCMQMDSHSDLIQHWDRVVKDEWFNTKNEFGVISHRPRSMAEMVDYTSGGRKEHVVSRICHVELNQAELPIFGAVPSEARNLREPLLMQGWSAGFSFAKCHLEETVPYDFFLPQIFQGEEFPRYARMWTRGYDVYTPTKNIVFHDSSKPNEKWPDSGIQRVWAQQRLRLLLQSPIRSDNVSVRDYANLNLYGLGKRRTLKQLKYFVGFDYFRGSKIGETSCSKVDWVPYDTSISPMENQYTEEADDEIDPMPIMPLRTKPVYAEYNDNNSIGYSPKVHPKNGVASKSLSTEKPLNVMHPQQKLMLHFPKSFADEAHAAQEVLHKMEYRMQNMEHKMVEKAEDSSLSVKVLFIIWLIGIICWFFTFARSKGSGRMRRKFMNGHKNM